MSVLLPTVPAMTTTEGGSAGEYAGPVKVSVPVVVY